MAPENDDMSATAKRAAVRSTASGSSAEPKSSWATWLTWPKLLTWRSRLIRILDRFPPLGEPLEGLGARIGFWFVVACAVVYTIYLYAFLSAAQTAWQTHAEDMGIMTQALWNTTHGALLHQTICNIVSDTNCIGDVSRFAIHFEPIMLPIALLYALIPHPQTLQFLQTAVVASGALPVYWLASRRLRSALAGVAFALLYLIYPPLQAAVAYDFHAVTLAAAFLLFALYFMMTRNNWGLFIACLLAMSTKEEIPATVFMIALVITICQRRWKVGSALAGTAILWLIVELLVMRAASPLGHSPTAARYSALGASPTQVAATLLFHPTMVLRQYILNSSGIYYLRTLLAGTGYLAALSPWSLLLAGPELAINLLSSDPSMRSGLYQYNAAIAPVMIFAAIDAVWWISRLGGWLAQRLPASLATIARWPWPRLVLASLTIYAMGFGAYTARARGETPLTPGITWPQATAHSNLANQLIAQIPESASVSAQSDLVPHISNRRYIYLFPYQMDSADYVFLDVTGSIYPQLDRNLYAQQVQGLLRNTDYHVVAATDGYLLLKRGAGPELDPKADNPYGLPPSFYTFVTHPATPTHTLNVTFGGQLQLIGYDVTPATTIYSDNPYLQVVTYWRVTAPLSAPAYPQIDLTGPSGATLSHSAFPASEWLGMTQWKPGAIYAVDSAPMYVASAAGGLNAVAVRVFAGVIGAPNPQPFTATISGPSSEATLTDQNAGVTIAYESVH